MIKFTGKIKLSFKTEKFIKIVNWKQREDWVWNLIIEWKSKQKGRIKWFEK